MTAIAAYEAGLTGRADCWLRPVGGREHRLPLARWTAGAGRADLPLLRECLSERAGPVLDVGCGPGRLTAALASAGVAAVGIDLSAVAVGMTRARGAAAWRRDVFGALPLEGMWGCVLLADGNIGIGGDPVALLTRLRSALAPGGRVVADVRSSGGVRREWHWLEARVAGGRSFGGPLPWASVGADAVDSLGRSAGLEPAGLTAWPGRGRRSVAVWRKAPW